MIVDVFERGMKFETADGKSTIEYLWAEKPSDKLIEKIREYAEMIDQPTSREWKFIFDAIDG